MKRWYQTLAASLLALLPTRSMAAAGWDNHIGSNDKPNGPDKRPTMPYPAIVINRLCEIEQDLEPRQADMEEAAEEVAQLQHSTVLQGSTFRLGVWSSGPRAGRWFDAVRTIDGEPAWLSYLAGDPDQGSNGREGER